MKRFIIGFCALMTIVFIAAVSTAVANGPPTAEEQQIYVPDIDNTAISFEVTAKAPVAGCEVTGKIASAEARVIFTNVSEIVSCFQCHSLEASKTITLNPRVLEGHYAGDRHSPEGLHRYQNKYKHIGKFSC